MAHTEQRQFVSLVKRLLVDDEALEKSRILEVGSFDFNGTIRAIFSDCQSYTGVDLVAGPGVDVIGSGNKLRFPDGNFDIAISCECFEHDQHWVDTLKNMVRMTRPGGFIIITCALLGRLEHGTKRSDPEQAPGTQSAGLDYYKNLSERDFRENFPLEDYFSFFRFYTRSWPADLYFVGIKKGGDTPSPHAVSVFETAVRKIRGDSKPLSLRRILHAVHTTLPLRLMSCLLPEATYQDTAIAYLRLKNALRTASPSQRKN